MLDRRYLIATALTLVLGAAPATAQDKSIVVASTTSTQDSGLFGHILPLFKQRSGIDVKVVDRLDADRKGHHGQRKKDERLDVRRGQHHDHIGESHPDGERDEHDAGAARAVGGSLRVEREVDAAFHGLETLLGMQAAKEVRGGDGQRGQPHDDEDDR